MRHKCTAIKVTQVSELTKLRFVTYTEKRKANLPGIKQWWQYFVTIKAPSTSLIKKH
jgi:hypothetical protein